MLIEYAVEAHKNCVYSDDWAVAVTWIPSYKESERGVKDLLEDQISDTRSESWSKVGDIANFALRMLTNQGTFFDEELEPFEAQKRLILTHLSV